MSATIFSARTIDNNNTYIRCGVKEYLQINQAIQVFERFRVKVVGKIITAQMAVNIVKYGRELNFSQSCHLSLSRYITHRIHTYTVHILYMYLQKCDLFFHVVRELSETVTGAIYVDVLTLTTGRHTRTDES